MKYAFLFVFLLSLSSIIIAHDSPQDHPIHYTFKDRIHSMCSGHYHLGDSELKEICNHFPDHFNDILELQANPPKFRTERYIQKMSVLVIFSDTLTAKQKHDFHRRSYKMALEARKNGDEWKWLLGLLVEKTDALSLPELQDLINNTKHEPLKPLVQNAIERAKKISNETIIDENVTSGKDSSNATSNNTPTLKIIENKSTLITVILTAFLIASLIWYTKFK